MRRSSWQVRFMTAVQTHVIHRGSMSTIAVVGFGPGISSAVAEKFGPEGFSVGLVARNQDCLASGVAALKTKEDMKLGALASRSSGKLTCVAILVPLCNLSYFGNGLFPSRTKVNSFGGAVPPADAAFPGTAPGAGGGAFGNGGSTMPWPPRNATYCFPSSM